jgi:hypothetical protein
MTVQRSLSLPFALPDDYKQDKNLFGTIPFELLRRCLFNLDLKSLLSFFEASKECYMNSFKVGMWEDVAEKMKLSVVLPITQLSFQKSYAEKKACDALMYNTLKLEENLGSALCSKIEEMPIWDGAIVHDDVERKFLRLSQFPRQNEQDGISFSYKAVRDNNLYLILITTNRWNSKVIWFNSTFDINSNKKNDYLNWEHGVDGSSGFYIDTSADPSRKFYELKRGWARVKDNVFRALY